MHENREIVDQAFVKLHGEGSGIGRVDRLNKRNELAKQLVTTTYQNMAVGLEERTQEAHKRELSEWELELEAIGEADDVKAYVSSMPASCLTLISSLVHVIPSSLLFTPSSNSLGTTRRATSLSLPLPRNLQMENPISPRVSNSKYLLQH